MPVSHSHIYSIQCLNALPLKALNTYENKKIKIKQLITRTCNTGFLLNRLEDVCNFNLNQNYFIFIEQIILDIKIQKLVKQQQNK